MGDFIDLTLDDEQSRDSSCSPLNRSDASYIKQAADYGDLSNLDLPPVKSEPADFSDSDCVMISSADSLSDRYAAPCGMYNIIHIGIACIHFVHVQ